MVQLDPVNLTVPANLVELVDPVNQVELVILVKLVDPLTYNNDGSNGSCRQSGPSGLNNKKYHTNARHWVVDFFYQNAYLPPLFGSLQRFMALNADAGVSNH